MNRKILLSALLGAALCTENVHAKNIHQGDIMNFSEETVRLVPASVPLTAYTGETRFHRLEDALLYFARRSRQNPALQSGIVLCEEGVYNFADPILITPAHCSVPVTIRPVSRKKVCFSRAVPLKNWTKCKVNGKTVFKTALAPELTPDNRFPVLFVNGRRAEIASYPGKGREDLRIASLATGDGEEPFTSFHTGKGDFSADWHEMQGIECLMFQNWNDLHLPVRSFDAKSNLLTFRRRTFMPLHQDCRFRFENVREMLQEPGQYYFDPAAHVLLYLPRAGETCETLDACIPAAGPLLLLKGEPGKGRWVERLHFENIEFRYSGGGAFPEYANAVESGIPGVEKIPNPFAAWAKHYTTPAGGAPQGAIHVPGMVMGTAVRDLSFCGCRFTRSGRYALCLYGGAQRITVDRCTMEDLGGGGILVSGSNAPDAPETERASHLVFTSNHIHGCGRIFRSAIGILLGYADRVLIEHNHIHDLYYTGISAGWVWGYAHHNTADVRIGHNLIYDIGQKMLSDMGGIYTLGKQPGTRIYGNVIYNVSCRIYGGFAIYLDEGSSHIVVEKNLCWNTSVRSFEQHFGRENIYRDNIAAGGDSCVLQIKRGNECQLGYDAPGENYSCDAVILHNVFLPKKGTAVYNASTEGGFKHLICDLNLIGPHDPKCFASTWATKKKDSLKAWQTMGYDTHSVFTDPGFADPAHGDFRLQKGAEYAKIGYPSPQKILAEAGIMEPAAKK